MVFRDNTTSVDKHDQAAVNQHMLKQIDDIRKEVLTIHSHADTEVKQIEKMVHAVYHQVCETDGQVDRLERLEPMIRNIERSIRSLESKVKTL